MDSIDVAARCSLREALRVVDEEGVRARPEAAIHGAVAFIDYMSVLVLIGVLFQLGIKTAINVPSLPILLALISDFPVAICCLNERGLPRH